MELKTNINKAAQMLFACSFGDMWMQHKRRYTLNLETNFLQLFPTLWKNQQSGVVIWKITEIWFPYSKFHFFVWVNTLSDDNRGIARRSLDLLTPFWCFGVENHSSDNQAIPGSGLFLPRNSMYLDFQDPAWWFQDFVECMVQTMLTINPTN